MATIPEPASQTDFFKAGQILSWGHAIAGGWENLFAIKSSKKIPQASMIAVVGELAKNLERKSKEIEKRRPEVRAYSHDLISILQDIVGGETIAAAIVDEVIPVLESLEFQIESAEKLLSANDMSVQSQDIIKKLKYAYDQTKELHDAIAEFAEDLVSYPELVKRSKEMEAELRR